MERHDAPRRLALLIEYQGTAFGGSQYQKNAPTVQDSLERALSSLTSEPIRVALAGRTDAGVHASALLGRDMGGGAAAEVPREFAPRRQALSRRYRYTLYLGPQRPALRR